MNNEELNRLITENGRDIYNFCLNLTMSRQEAEELYQDTFLTAMDKLKEDRNPKSYLMGTAVRLYRNRRRKTAWRQRIAPVSSQEEMQEKADDGTPESEYMEKEERRAVRKAVNTLREPLRTTVLLYYSSELSVEETAEIMHVPAGTVKSRLHKARKLLKNILEADING